MTRIFIGIDFNAALDRGAHSNLPAMSAGELMPGFAVDRWL